MNPRPPPPRQLSLGLLPRRVPGGPEWESFGATRRSAALRRLAHLIARVA